MKVETLVVGAFEVNCWLIHGAEGQALVIDPGADAGAILEHLRSKRLAPAAYLFTHGHFDHISALGELLESAPAPIGMHPADSAWAFTELNQYPPDYPPTAPPKEITYSLADSQALEIAGLKFTVIATPGHSPGGVCFHFPAAQALFCGDTLFSGSVGRTDLPGGNSRILGQSLKKLATLPDATRICPGHGPTSTIGEEKATNYFLQI